MAIGPRIPPTLLLADSNKEFRQQLSKLLQEEGCLIQEADGKKQAVSILNSRPFDRMVVALDLTDEEAPENIYGGLSLAEQRENVPIVLIGDQPAWDVVRQVIRGHLAEDWVPRSEGPEAVLRSIMPSPVILHISDLQFGPYQREMIKSPYPKSADPIDIHIEKIRHDLAERLNVQPNILVLTGDITEHGLPQQFDVAETFLKRLARRLDIPTQRIVVTPGNHDICWPDARAAFSKAVYARSGRIIEDDEADEGLKIAILGQDILFQKFVEYQRFYSRLYEGQRTFEHKLYDIFSLPALNILIASLNSCVFACHLARRGWIGNDQVLGAGDEMDRIDPCHRCIRVGVFHHHVFPKNKEDFDDRVEDFDEIRPAIEKSDFKILMHGHQHKSEAYEMRPIGGKPLHILAAGSLLLLREKTVVGNQYQVLTVRTSPKKSWLYLRRYDPDRPSSSGKGDGEWVPDTSYQHANDAGIVEFVI